MSYDDSPRMLEDYAQPERRKFPSRGWVTVDGELVKQYGAYSHGYLLNYCAPVMRFCHIENKEYRDGYAIGERWDLDSLEERRFGDAPMILCWRQEVDA